MLQIVASLIDTARGVIYDRHMFIVQATGAYPRRKHLKGAPIGLALALPSNSKTSFERVSKDKRSSLLGVIISDKGKKFYDIDTRRTGRSRQSWRAASTSSRPRFRTMIVSKRPNMYPYTGKSNKGEAQYT
jgi:hypothetical protein